MRVLYNNLSRGWRCWMSLASIGWYLKQLLPLTYRSFYRDANGPRFAVWRMWFGRVFDLDDVRTLDQFQTGRDFS